LNFSDHDPRKTIAPDDIKRKLDRIEYKLKPLDIVLVESGAAPYFNTAEYRNYGAGIGKEGTLWLMSQGIKVVGTDSFSWDKPFPLAVEDYTKNHNAELLWEGHLAGRYGEYFQMEKLTNLNELPGFGFKVICFPIKLKAAGASWIRTVALLDE
jgi:kynurenine formamidase